MFIPVNQSFHIETKVKKTFASQKKEKPSETIETSQLLMLLIRIRKRCYPQNHSGTRQKRLLHNMDTEKARAHMPTLRNIKRKHKKQQKVPKKHHF